VTGSPAWRAAAAVSRPIQPALAMLTAVTDRVSKTGLTARLEPAPDRCCVVLDAG
jgi:hypothetical protein